MNKALLAIFLCLLALLGSSIAVIFAKSAQVSAYEVKYANVCAMQQISEKTISALRQENRQLQSALESWKAKYAKINEDNANAKKKLDELQNASKEICAFLATDIPDDVWNLLFPKGKPTYCVNPN